MTEEQIFCITHKFGPVVSNGEQKQEHESNNCVWETYNPEKHLKDYEQSKIKKRKSKINNDNDDDEQNPVEKIYDFALQHIKKIVVSNTDNNQVFVLFDNNSHIESLDLSSSRARAWLKSAYYKISERIYSDDAYKGALSQIKANAIMTNTVREEIYNRIAVTDNQEIYYDLADSEWSLVKITKDSVDIVPVSIDTPIFLRKQQQQTQFMPVFDDNDALGKLVTLLRIKREDQAIFKVHLVSLFLENCPIPIMPIVGEHGSIKSTITKSVKQIVDPAGEGNSSLPRNHNDLVLFFNNRYLANFDNVSEFNQEVSDTFCKAITGDGQSKRALYENSDEIIYNYRRKIVFNGIAPSLDFADLRDRCLSYETHPLQSNERITEDEFNKQFTRLVPAVLGQIFQTLSTMLSLHESVKEEIKEPPRMADFTIYGECISRALGYTPYSFITNYKERIQTNSIDIVEEYPIISLIEKAMSDKDHYEDTVTAFYKGIKTIAETQEIEITHKDVNFPKSANKVRRHIQKLKPNLRALGFEIDIQPYNKRDKKHPRGSHVIYITRIDSEGSILSNNDKVSQSSLSSLSTENHTQNEPLFDSDNDSNNQTVITKPLSKTPDITHKKPLTDMTGMTDILSDNSFSDTQDKITQVTKNEKFGNTTSESSNEKSQISHKYEVNEENIDPTRKTFACNNCNTTWVKTTLPLDEIQAQHSMSNENHTIIEVDGDN